MRFGMIVLLVTDLAEAKRFYEDVLGFTVSAEAAHRLDLRFGNLELAVFRCPREADPKDHAEVARSVLCFEIDSLEEAMRDLRGKGVRLLHNEPGRNETSRYVAFADPSGNVHEIFERLPTDARPR